MTYSSPRAVRWKIDAEPTLEPKRRSGVDVARTSDLWRHISSKSSRVWRHTTRLKPGRRRQTIDVVIRYNRLEVGQWDDLLAHYIEWSAVYSININSVFTLQCRHDEQASLVVLVIRLWILWLREINTFTIVKNVLSISGYRLARKATPIVCMWSG